MNLPIHTLAYAMLGMSWAALLSGCNPGSDPASQSSANVASDKVASAKVEIAPKCDDCGTIVNIEEMKLKGSGTGVGAAAGAVIGAVVGHQIGDGRGQDIATVAGAVGGGIAGNEVERRMKSTSYFHVTIAMENGGTRTVDVDALNGLANGMRVKIVGNNLQIAPL